jgi:tetratricopeptide (TPR) repeat protein
MLLATSTVLAVEAGPDNPRKHYWLRNTGARVVEAGPMDARLREIADAFGLGDYGTCRRLANTLLDSTKDPALRAEAAGFLMQSHLAEGDFESARAAAERINDAESLARINGIEANYKAEVGRLQRIVASTTDPAEAAHAQFLTARAHEGVHCLEVAVESYWKVVKRYPWLLEAGEAVGQIVGIHCTQGEPERALLACQEAIALVPDSPTAARAARAIAMICFTYDRPEHASQRVRGIAAAYSGTPADAVTASLLSAAHYRRGMEQYGEGTLLLAAQELEAAIATGGLTPQEQFAALHTLGLCYLATQQFSRAISCLNRALDLDGPRAGRLGIRYQVGLAYYGLGSLEAAQEAFEASLRDAPGAPWAASARDYTRQCEEALAAGVAGEP